MKRHVPCTFETNRHSRRHLLALKCSCPFGTSLYHGPFGIHEPKFIRRPCPQLHSALSSHVHSAPAQHRTTQCRSNTPHLHRTTQCRSKLQLPLHYRINPPTEPTSFGPPLHSARHNHHSIWHEPWPNQLHCHSNTTTGPRDEVTMKSPSPVQAPCRMKPRQTRMPPGQIAPAQAR